MLVRAGAVGKIGRTRRENAVTSSAFAHAIGDTWGGVADGLGATAGGVGSGTNNFFHQFQRLIGGSLQPVPVPNVGKSGTTIKTDSGANKAFIVPYAIDAVAAQCPDAFIHYLGGANDNLLSTNPGANPASGFTTSTFLQDAYDSITYAYNKFVAYGGKTYVVIESAGSTKAGEATYAATIRAALAAFVAAMTAIDSRVIYISLAAMTPASDYSVDGPGGQYVHLDERGGYYIANAVFNALSPRIPPATADEIIDMIVAGTYPLMSGSQLDTNTALSVTTGGTLTGPGITGTLATNLLVTNSTGSTGITSSQVATTGGRTETVIDFTSATATTGDGKILIQDKTSISVSATPGQPIRTGWILKGSAGFRNFGSDWNGGNGGSWGGQAASLVNNALQGADETHALNQLVFNNLLGTSPLNFGSSTTFTGKRSYALFYKSGDTPTGTMGLTRPFFYKISNRTRTTPAYIGDIRDSGGAYIFSAASGGSRMRPSGTVSQAAGGTLRVEPGSWNMFGLTEADFATRRVYKGNSGNTGVGTGTLLATLTGSNWTTTIAAAGVTTGDLIYVEVDCNNGIGGTITARSSATVTAT